jgi:hypothetical protein
MTDIPTLRRPAFFNGQSLTADDLNAVAAYHRELLWLHQRTLHGSGIVSGLSVSGAKGDKTVTVSPGYAVDTSGRSIVLATPQPLDVPSVVSGPTGKAVTFYLTITYVDDDQLAAATRSGTCGSLGAVRRIDAPALAFSDPASIGDDVVLGAITVANCKLAGPVDLSLRRSALPDRAPYVYAGQTEASTTTWGLWQASSDANSAIFGLTVSVDTSEAGFANVPKYQALVVGSRTVTRSGGGSSAVVDGYVQVSHAAPNGFDLTMTLPKGDAAVNPDWALTKDVLTALPANNGWSVSWLGVES